MTIDWEKVEAMAPQLEKELEVWEREEFGTNDRAEIRDAIQEREWNAAQERMTGMDEEQAEWESAE